MATGTIESVDSELTTLDRFFDTLHPIQYLAHFPYLDFTRVNGLFEFVNLNMLKLTMCLSACDNIGNFITLVLNIREQKMDEAQRVLAVSSTSFLMFTRGFAVLTKSKEIAKLCNDLDRLFPRTLDEQRRLGAAEELADLKRRFAKFHKCITFAWIIFIGVPLGQFFIFYDRGSNDPIPQEYHQHVSWKPFKKTYRAYPYLFLYESIVTILATTLILTWDQVFTVSVSQLCLQFRRLCEDLATMNAADTKDAVKADAFYEQFRKLMIRQQFLYKVCDDLNNIFNVSILISDMVSAFSICFHIYLMTTEDDIVVIMGFVGPCFIQVWLTYDVAKRGTELETVTSGIKEALYGQAWYEGSISYRKYITMWMQYTNEPTQLTAFKMFIVNMEHFQDMMMLAYQLFTFLQSRGK